MKKKLTTFLYLITFGVVLYAALMNFTSVLLFLNKIIELIFPILLGLILAFILSVPMKGFENLLTRIFSTSRHKYLLQRISLVLTLSCIVLVITLAFTIAIPELVASAQSIVPLVKNQWPKLVSLLNSYNIDLSQISQWFASFDLEGLYSNAGMFWDSAMGFASSTVTGITNIVFGFIIAIYILLSKNILATQMNKLMKAHLKPPIADKLRYVAALAHDTYCKFLSGQCVEAIVLGILIFIAYSLFKLPYAGLVAFLTSIFSFVPYVGALAACFIGAFLTLLASPSQFIICIVVYLVVQFIENQFIYPHVVGTSVGLSPLWTLIAALLGGKLFGLPGIIFFIPLVAVFYILVRENTNRKLREQEVINIE